MDNKLNELQNQITQNLEAKIGLLHEDALKVFDSSVCFSDLISQTPDRVIFKINEDYIRLSSRCVALQPLKFIRSLIALGVSISSLNFTSIIISLCDVFDYFLLKLTYEEASILVALYLEQNKQTITDDNIFEIYTHFSEKRTDRYVKDKSEFYQVLQKLEKTGIIAINDGIYKAQDVIV